MNPPDPSIARRHNWPVGKLYTDRWDVWRWDGEAFRPLQRGDVCRTEDPLVWERWDGPAFKGGGWRTLRIERGALVSVTVDDERMQMADALCTVIAVVSWAGGWHAWVKPAFGDEMPAALPVNLMMAVAGPAEFRERHEPTRDLQRLVLPGREEIDVRAIRAVVVAHALVERGQTVSKDDLAFGPALDAARDATVLQCLALAVALAVDVGGRTVGELVHSGELGWPGGVATVRMTTALLLGRSLVDFATARERLQLACWRCGCSEGFACDPDCDWAAPNLCRGCVSKGDAS